MVREGKEVTGPGRKAQEKADGKRLDGQKNEQWLEKEKKLQALVERLKKRQMERDSLVKRMNSG